MKEEEMRKGGREGKENQDMLANGEADAFKLLYKSYA